MLSLYTLWNGMNFGLMSLRKEGGLLNLEWERKGVCV